MKRQLAIGLLLLSSFAPGAALADGGQCRPTTPPKSCLARVSRFGFPPWNDSYLEGEGLELLHFTTKSGQVIPNDKEVLIPKASCGSSKLTSVTVEKCTAQARGMAICQVDPAGASICGKKDASGVIVVNGFWDNQGKWSAGDPGTITLSCAAEAAKGQLAEFDGAITSCIEMGYHPTTNGNEFRACIRAIRADYCGDGVPHTLGGTLLEVHDASVNKMDPNMCADFGLVYEATWSEDGALCVYHDRWSSKNMTYEELCPGRFTQQVDGGRCSSNATAFLTTHSQCNVCPVGTDPAQTCSGRDEDPICSGAAHKPAKRSGRPRHKQDPKK